MRENELDILEQYEIDVKNIRKVRDAFLCETEQGLFLIKELCFSERRLSVLEQINAHLLEQGCKNIDWTLKTKEGALFSTSEDGTKYFLKKWFGGKECDVYKERDILEAVKNLTQIHRALRNVSVQEEDAEITCGEDLREEYFRHNREMRKVRSFMRDRVGKGDFEMTFLKCFDSMYECAERAYTEIQSSNYGDLYRISSEENRLIHGDYNYHNILMSYAGTATVNFEHEQKNIQVTDLYYFLRKVMEKNHWNVELGNKMLECYNCFLPFEEGELDYIAICLAYPEKFWKVANSYYRSRKVWIPAKNVEKLEMVIKQTEEKKQFLKTIFSFHL